MGKKEKLIDRFINEPKDFTYRELKTLFGYFEYKEIPGKGSRVKFINESKDIIIVHKPHNSEHVKQYIIRQIKEKLNDQGMIE